MTMECLSNGNNLARFLKLLPQHPFYIFLERRADDAGFGHDSRDERVVRHIKGGVIDLNTVGRGLDTGEIDHLFFFSFFDGDLLSAPDLKVET